MLLVEDDALIAIYADDVLTESGYTVIGPFNRIQKALEAAHRETLHAAVLDVNVAGEPVWPVATALIERRVPFLFLTGYGRQLTPPAHCAHAARIDKPFTRADLRDAMVTLLNC